jgi:hypothetical protein
MPSTTVMTALDAFAHALAVQPEHVLLPAVLGPDIMRMGISMQTILACCDDIVSRDKKGISDPGFPSALGIGAQGPRLGGGRQQGQLHRLAGLRLRTLGFGIWARHIQGMAMWALGCFKHGAGHGAGVAPCSFMMLWPGKQLDSLQSNPHKLLSTVHCILRRYQEQA